MITHEAKWRLGRPRHQRIFSGARDISIIQHMNRDLDRVTTEFLASAPLGV